MKAGPRLLRTAFLLGCALSAPIACAQGYPGKPVRMIVPFPAGGGIDTVSRLIGPKLAEGLGQPFLVDNRVGASGTLGTDLAAKAAPDGYTLLATFASHAMNATLYQNLPFDTLNDFAPITLIATVPNILVVNPSLPVKTVKELIALAKLHPGELRYASIGSGTPAHLSAELFNLMAGITMTHVPYKGAPPSMIALISGEVQLTFTTVLVALPHVNAGKLRAVAVCSLKRSTAMPAVPTVDESGLKGYESTAWYGLLAPAKTPPAIVERLNRETARVLQLPDIRESLLKQGAEPVGSTPEEFGKLIRADLEKWTKVVKATGARVE
jgi:tripartite-type tricarboxylate transporter receptor subunit TctC